LENDPEIIKKELKNHGDVCVLNDFGQTPLMAACFDDEEDNTEKIALLATQNYDRLPTDYQKKQQAYLEKAKQLNPNINACIQKLKEKSRNQIKELYNMLRLNNTARSRE